MKGSFLFTLKELRCDCDESAAWRKFSTLSLCVSLPHGFAGYQAALCVSGENTHRALMFIHTSSGCGKTPLATFSLLLQKFRTLHLLTSSRWCISLSHICSGATLFVCLLVWLFLFWWQCIMLLFWLLFPQILIDELARWFSVRQVFPINWYPSVDSSSEPIHLRKWVFQMSMFVCGFYLNYAGNVVRCSALFLPIHHCW